MNVRSHVIECKLEVERPSYNIRWT